MTSARSSLLRSRLSAPTAIVSRPTGQWARACRTKPGETTASFGLIIIRAKDETDARRIADTDPMHASGVRKYDLYAWSLNEGRIEVTLNFSDQTFGFA